MSEQDTKKKKRKDPVWPGGVSPKAAGCSYLELVQPLYDRFQEEAEKRKAAEDAEKAAAVKPAEEKKKPEKDDLPSPKAMGCGYLTLPDRPRR